MIPVTRPSLPLMAAHCDWSVSPRKRWMASALWAEDGFEAFAPEPVGETGALLGRLRAAAGLEAAVLVGFDFPIGLPLAYARRCGIAAFLEALPKFGRGAWADFYRPAAEPGEIGLSRPFYPLRPGAARARHLTRALGVETLDDLRRSCELPHPGRRAAAPLFWTLGGQQVGKAAACGWREVLAPALAGREGVAPLRTAVWPFDGPLTALLRPGQVVIAETYPAEFYAPLGVRFGREGERGKGIGDGGDGQGRGKGDRPVAPTGGKRFQTARAANAPALLGWAGRAGVHLSRELQAQIEAGFGPRPDGEDRFDAIAGLFGMLKVLRGELPAGEPEDAGLLQVEGWILGQGGRRG